MRGPRIMSTSEGRASKKAKIVDNESLDGDSNDGGGRITCIHFVHHRGKYLLVQGTWCGAGFFILHLVLVLYYLLRPHSTKSKMLKVRKMVKGGYTL